MVTSAKHWYRSVVQMVEVSLGIDAGYFVRGGTFGLMQQIVGLGSGLVIAYVFGHFASKAVYGEYSLILAVVAVVSIVSMPGLNTALMRSVGQGFDTSLPRTINRRLGWSVLGSVTLIGIGWYYQWRGSDVLPIIFMVTAIFFLMLTPLQSVYAFLVAKKRFDTQAMIASVSSVLTAILVGLAVWRTGNLLLILGGHFLGQIVPLVVGYGYARRLVNKSAGKDADLLPYGYFLTGTQVVPTLAGYANQILLASYLGVDQLARFAVTTKFTGIVQKNFDVFYRPVTAKLAGQNVKQHRQIIKKHLAKFLLMGGFLGLVSWLLIPSLVEIFYGAGYRDTHVLARWYSLVTLVLPVTWLWGDMMTFQKRKRSLLVVNTLLPLVKLMAYLVVIPKWQITGLIVIMVAERFLTAVYSGSVLWLSPARKT